MNPLVVPIYLTGALIMFWRIWRIWRIWRLVEGIAERDCPCQRSRMTLFSTVAAASPGGYLLVLSAFALCWPVLIAVGPVKSWRYRNDPRCPNCGMRTAQEAE